MHRCCAPTSPSTSAEAKELEQLLSCKLVAGMWFSSPNLGGACDLVLVLQS